MDSIVILSDQQARYDDRVTRIGVMDFLSDFQPNTIVNNGDLFDFESLSVYRKTPRAKQSLQADLEAGREWLNLERRAAPNARIVLVEGNHEARLHNYILDNADALAGLPTLDAAAFIGVSDFEVEYVGPYGAGLDWHGILIYHGALVRGGSALTARAEYVDAGTSGVSGHTHKLGAFYHTDRSGSHAWYEGGCLCNISGPDTPPDHHGPRVRNWQQGFVYGYWSRLGMWNLYQVAITDHKFVVEGVLYGPKKG